MIGKRKWFIVYLAIGAMVCCMAYDVGAKSNTNSYPSIYNKILQQAKVDIDQAIIRGIEVPIDLFSAYSALSHMYDMPYYYIGQILTQNYEYKKNTPTKISNLRRDVILIHPKAGKKDADFLTVIENHGIYSPQTELPHQPYGKISQVSLMDNNDKSANIEIKSKEGLTWHLALDKMNGSINIKHNKQ